MYKYNKHKLNENHQIHIIIPQSDVSTYLATMTVYLTIGVVVELKIFLLVYLIINLTLVLIIRDAVCLTISLTLFCPRLS